MNKRETNHKRVTTRARLFKTQSGICVYCGREIKGKPSLDHIVPVDICTKEDLEIMGDNNFVVCCKRCNKSKGNRVIFSNLFDREIYPILLDIPYFFRYTYITYNHKDRKGKK